MLEFCLANSFHLEILFSLADVFLIKFLKKKFIQAAAETVSEVCERTEELNVEEVAAAAPAEAAKEAATEEEAASEEASEEAAPAEEAEKSEESEEAAPEAAAEESEEAAPSEEASVEESS